MIYLYTDAGLCNRLRALDSALLAAERIETEVQLYWPLNNACHALFSSVFEPVETITVIEDVESAVAAEWRRLTQSVRTRCRLLLRADLMAAGKFKIDVSKLPRYRRIFLQTDHAFLYPENFQWFVPLPELMERIRSCREQATDAIGLHIRRGDHQTAIKQSPLSGFETQIDIRLASEPDSRFFLCTDCPDVREQLTDRYGRHVMLTSDHELTRQNESGIANAVVELWTLSTCPELWGSRGSSFSETAFHLSQQQMRLRFIVGSELVDN